MRDTKKNVAHKNSHDSLFLDCGDMLRNPANLTAGLGYPNQGGKNLRFGWVNDWDAAKSGTLPPTTYTTKKQ